MQSPLCSGLVAFFNLKELHIGGLEQLGKATSSMYKRTVLKRFCGSLASSLPLLVHIRLEEYLNSFIGYYVKAGHSFENGRFTPVIEMYRVSCRQTYPPTDLQRLELSSQVKAFGNALASQFSMLIK
jgi:hypothetical protein